MGRSQSCRTGVLDSSFINLRSMTACDGDEDADLGVSMISPLKQLGCAPLPHARRSGLSRCAACSCQRLPPWESSRWPRPSELFLHYRVTEKSRAAYGAQNRINSLVTRHNDIVTARGFKVADLCMNETRTVILKADNVISHLLIDDMRSRCRFNI